jgi:O-methyltransferase
MGAKAPFLALKTLIGDLMTGMMGGLAWSRPEGCFAEVGVYQGGSARVLYSIAERQGRKLFLYDTFSGMPFKGEFDTHDVGMFSDCSAEEVQKAMPRAIVCAGVFPGTVVAMPPVAFVHADADQYQSTVDIIKTFSPLMVDGGMILFDDYYCVPSCIKAVDEYFSDKKLLPDGRAVVTF